MGWSIGYDGNWDRDIGYGVPAICDHPKCKKVIDRGLSYVCGSDPYGGEYGCGLYFCEKHLTYRKPRGSYNGVGLCSRCYNYVQTPYEPKPDIKRWVLWKLNDESWAVWRKENKGKVKEMLNLLNPTPKSKKSKNEN